jgi:hypothetical protein
MARKSILCNSDDTASLHVASDTGAVNVSKVAQHDRLSLAQERAELRDRTESIRMGLPMPDAAVGIMATHAGHASMDQSQLARCQDMNTLVQINSHRN